MKDQPPKISDDCPGTRAFGRAELRDALVTWTRLSLYSFGSPAVQLSAMYRVLVEEKRWISESRYLNALNYCMAIPGPESQQLAIYVGWITHRLPGALLAGLLFLAPGVLCILALSFAYVADDDSKLGDALFYGIKPAVLAVTIGATIQLWGQLLRTRLMVAIAILAFVASFFFDLAFLIVVVTAATLGLLGGLGRFGEGALKAPHLLHAMHHDAITPQEPERPLPPYTQLTARGLLRATAWCALLWIGPLLALLAIAGPGSVFGQIAILASKAALLTFGGPYGATAYVTHQATEVYGWMTSDQMSDGIAMAELAPGPSILFLQFAGFVAAFRHPGALPPFLAGTLGALLSVWIIFVPTFWYVFLVAPFIEVFRNDRIISSTLSAITGAIVGILVTFALRFAGLTLFREGISITGSGLEFDVPNLASTDLWALAICVAAGVAIFRFNVGIVTTMVLSSVAGAALALFGVLPQ